MPWEMYKVVFKVLSPIHIGYRKFGNVMETRHYVPARVLLGALTAQITREVFGNTKNWLHYRLVGEILNKVFTASYFFPTTNSDGTINKFPWDEDFPVYEYISSYVSTALERGSRTPLEASLHETEFIAPHTLHSGEQVYLVGYFFLNKELKVNDISADEIETDLCNRLRKKLRDVFEKLPSESKKGLDSAIREYVARKKGYTLQIGAERTYGWGKIALDKRCGFENDRYKNGECNVELNVELNGERPVVKLTKGERIPLHIKAEGDDQSVLIDGNVEPLVRREWREGPGSVVVCDGLAFAPGSYCKQNLKVAIGQLGYGSVTSLN